MADRPLLFIERLEAPEPIGMVHIVSDARRVVALDFNAPEERLMRLLRARYGPDVTVNDLAVNDLSPVDSGLNDGQHRQGFASSVSAYFAGDMTALDAIPADRGGSPFQQQVWAALREIPPGETRSYGWIAARIGRPGAARAVGLANALNPINLVVPCHRVVGVAGALTGYGGGLARKRWLLDFERRACRQTTDLCGAVAFDAIYLPG